MPSARKLLPLLLPALLTLPASAAVHYVDLNSLNPAPPYTNWPTAATNIQDAIDASDAGDQILVTNGVYQAGGRVVYGSLTNRVAVTRPVTLRSVNGPAVTIISGNPIRGTNAVRCVYLTNNAILAGFTLMNGATLNSGDPLKELSGGGAWCESSSAVLSNCVFATNVAVYYGAGVCQGTILNSSFISNSVVFQGGAAWQCTLSNCVLLRNLASSGGGAYGGALYTCTLTTNRALHGGGTYQSALYDCALTNNRAEGGAGGGSYQGTLSRCVLTGNWAYNAGGGTESATLWACKVLSNSTAYSQAGGVSSSTCFNCLLRGNLGGAYYSTLYNCTVVQNTAGVGGGIFGGTLFNSIVYYNSAPTGTNWFQSPVMTNCCTTPLPAGTGNITNAPLFVDLAGGNFHLQANSPCINSGANAYAPAGPDLDGNPRIVGNSVDIGAYEFQAPLHYVSASGTNPAAPYSSWATAATNIQDAVDAATGGDAVLVSNGIYSGSVSVTNPLTVLSVNGPRFTIIDGAGSVRCVSLTNSASLGGFTLTNGTDNIGNGGGGVWCASTNAVVTNCVITGNSAFGGGGAAGGTLYYCTLTGNSGVYGGGAAGCNLNNCTLVGNGASYGAGAHASALNNCLVVSNTVNATGAGAFDCTLINCTVWGNTALDGAGGIAGCVAQNSIIFANDPWNQSLCSVDYCCSSPLADGFGNISDGPALVDPSAGDFHLQTNSPCINSGYNAFATGAADLDSNRRIISGTVDIGAYEYQGAGSVISYAWLQGYGLPTGGSADHTDPDADGMNNWQEWIAGTDPTNSLSLLKMFSPSTNAPGLRVSWQSVGNRTYFLQRGTNLSQPGLTSLQSNITGQAGATIYTDTTATNPGPYFYRVGVQ